MEYVNFGKAGVRVSRLALGLGLRGQNDAAEAQRAIEHAIAQGINLIDCANIYGLMDDRRTCGCPRPFWARRSRASAMMS